MKKEKRRKREEIEEEKGRNRIEEGSKTGNRERR